MFLASLRKHSRPFQASEMLVSLGYGVLYGESGFTMSVISDKWPAAGAGTDLQLPSRRRAGVCLVRSALKLPAPAERPARRKNHFHHLSKVTQELVCRI
jgi:hypothetical protein